MPNFSKRSRKRLHTCHPSLVLLCNIVVSNYDCSIITGYRSKTKQNNAYHNGYSQLKYPNSLHNHTQADGTPLSLAVDVAPYPIDWNDLDRFRVFAGYVLGVASGLEIELRWGGDWNRNWNFKDQTFHDLPHFELADY